MEERNRVKNVMRDTRKDVRYVIWASRKLNRQEMLDRIKRFNYDPLNIRLKPGTSVEMNYEEEE